MASFYHGYIRQLIIAFNAYFSNIHIVRRTGDSVHGKPYQDIKVPIALSNRAKWLEQIREGTREKQVKIELPRMAFEITSFSYDASRKKNRNQTVQCTDEYGNTVVVNNPTPWNAEISLYIVSDNQEDCLQIVEQILPQFNPDIGFSFKNVIGITTNVPIVLNAVSHQDDYEGAMTDDRLVIYTLSFTAKLEMYGEVIDVGQLKPPVINGGGSSDNDNDGIPDDLTPGQTTFRLTVTTGTKKKKYYIASPGVYLTDSENIQILTE